MKNKHGFLLAEETLKIIISVISIGFLVYFLTSLYFANQGDKELEQAEASLEFLIKEINSLEEDDVREVTIFNPEGWFIISWPAGVYRIFSETENEIPSSCTSLKWKDCICFCENDKGSETCDKKGICRESSFKITKSEENTENSIKIENPPITLQINSESKEIDKIISK